MAKPCTVIFLGDGMADEPLDRLDGRTPLQHAATPAMDSIARDGVCGSLLTLPDEFPTSSEVANMSVLGCDLATEYCGRGPLEAAGRNIPLASDDKAFRLNLTATEGDVLKDFSAGHIAQDAAEELIRTLDESLGTDKVKFRSGVSYRNLLILSGPDFSARLKTDKPDDCHGEVVADHYPAPLAPEAEHTTQFLRDLIEKAPAILEQSPVNKRLVEDGKPPANGVWPWSGGVAGALRSIKDKYGISSAVISAVDVIVGLGRCLGMDVIHVEGATGYIDTNYEGKADGAIEALKSHDLVYLHVEAIDEVSHGQDLELKIKAIEDFDSRVIARVLDAIPPDRLNAAVLPDHPVPVAIGKHTRTPVPVAVRLAGRAPDNVTAFDEIACPSGALGPMTNGDLMSLLFAPRPERT